MPCAQDLTASCNRIIRHQTGDRQHRIVRHKDKTGFNFSPMLQRSEDALEF